MKVADLRNEKSFLESQIVLLVMSRKTEDKIKIRNFRKALEKIQRKLEKKV